MYRFGERRKVYKNICKYKDRREILRIKYGVVNGKKAPIEYLHAVKNINRKIQSWGYTIRRIDKRNNELLFISNKLKEWSGVNIKHSLLTSETDHSLERNIFYKYCLENGCSASLIAEFVGATRGDTIARARKLFTKRWEKNPEWREKYKNFKRFILEE